MPDLRDGVRQPPVSNGAPAAPVRLGSRVPRRPGFRLGRRGKACGYFTVTVTSSGVVVIESSA